MNCEDVDYLLDAYLDQELEVDQRLAIEQHLIHCRKCWRFAQEAQAFRSFFRANAPRYNAPAQLRDKVLAAVRSQGTKHNLAAWRRYWVHAAAVLVLSLSFSLTFFLPDKEKQLSSLAVLDHSRAIAVDHLVDVASEDRQAVKLWLAERLDFSPPVIDVPASGYSLLGGRVDVIQHRTVAAVVYKHGREVITLFCWPVNKETVSDADRLIDGYRVGTWSNAECNYIVVSKLSKREHDEFLESFRDHLESNIY